MVALSKQNTVFKISIRFCNCSISNSYKQKKTLGIKYHYYSKTQSLNSESKGSLLEGANCNEGPNDWGGIPASLSAKCRKEEKRIQKTLKRIAASVRRMLKS